MLYDGKIQALRYCSARIRFVSLQLDQPQRKSVDVLLSEGLADPWGVSNGGGLDFRVSTQRWQMLQDRLPECQVVIDDVETFVRGAEREMFNVSDAATWFEEYVSSVSKTLETNKSAQVDLRVLVSLNLCMNGLFMCDMHGFWGLFTRSDLYD